MTKKQILVVDDDMDFAESLSQVLEGKGFNVETANSGEEAIMKSINKAYDMTFMDVKLPNKNGVDCFEEIKVFRPDSKFIIMTGYSITSLLDKAKNIGVEDILKKPLNLLQVIAAAEKIKDNVIVILDDDRDFTESIRSLFESKHKKILTATTGLELIECIKTHIADVVILDLKLQHEAGIDIFLRLQKVQPPSSFIIVTGFADEESENINKMKELSVARVLEKPINPEELLSLVEEIQH